MLPIYRVHALKMGTITADQSEQVYGTQRGVLVDIPIWCAAVEGDGVKILVDTGLSDPQRWSVYNRHTVGAGETIEAALSQLGWRLGDVDVVINTHLHYDHAGNNLLFPQAEFFVSRQEWQYASNPDSAQEPIYDVARTSPDLTYLSYTLVDSDDFDVRRGLRLIKTPGHTPGHQSVIVNTAEGLLCITGDAAFRMENLTTPTPPGTFVSAEDALASIRKICSRADRVFMHHDPALTAFQSSDFPLVPKSAPK